MQKDKMEVVLVILVLESCFLGFFLTKFGPCAVTEKQKVHNIQRKDHTDCELSMLMMLKEHIYKTSVFSLLKTPRLTTWAKFFFCLFQNDIEQKFQ